MISENFDDVIQVSPAIGKPSIGTIRYRGQSGEVYKDAFDADEYKVSVTLVKRHKLPPIPEGTVVRTKVGKAILRKTDATLWTVLHKGRSGFPEAAIVDLSDKWIHSNATPLREADWEPIS